MEQSIRDKFQLPHVCVIDFLPKERQVGRKIFKEISVEIFPNLVNTINT